MLKRKKEFEDQPGDEIESLEVHGETAGPQDAYDRGQDGESNFSDTEVYTEDAEEPAVLFDRDSVAFVMSLVSHVVLIVAFAAIPVITKIAAPELVIKSEPLTLEEEPELDVITEIVYSEEPSEKIGANSIGQASVAMSTAPEIADISEIVTPQFTPSPISTLDLSVNVQKAVALTSASTVVRGMTGYGVDGTEGAVDRITYEIIQSVEERPTLVVWLFDASVSLTKRRAEIRERFDRIYEEIGLINEAHQQPSDRLLTSVVSFGQNVQLMLDKPTENLDLIKKSIDEIQLDSSGVEMVFSALYMAADNFKRLRIDRGDGPERNVMLIAVTDERGDDTLGMDKTIDLCRRFAIPVYIMGVPAPFGREFTYIKYVDPDPNFDQSPQWAQIDQGPETLVPERVQIGYKDNFFEEPVLDSGFGPYALSRTCYETGGIFFTIHPNRKYDRDIGREATEAFASHMQRFFEPNIMERYRPDYLSASEYQTMIRKSPLRSALVQGAQLARTGVLEQPRVLFVKRDEASFVNDLTAAQQQAARLGPGLAMLSQILEKGVPGRENELSSRWLASFDLSYATAEAERIRNEAYNQMLGKAKRGMNFEDPKNNTWTLRPSNDISVSSRLQKEADNAREIFERIVNEHKGTPWAYLARRELERPIGWEWKESFTDLNPPPPQNPGPANNNNIPNPDDEQRRMLERQAPKRPIPKL